MESIGTLIETGCMIYFGCKFVGFLLVIFAGLLEQKQLSEKEKKQ